MTHIEKKSACAVNSLMLNVSCIFYIFKTLSYKFLRFFRQLLFQLTFRRGNTATRFILQLRVLHELSVFFCRIQALITLYFEAP